MKVPTLENDYVKLCLLDLSHFKHLYTVAQQENLIQYSPSDISTPEKLKNYIEIAVDAYYHKTAIPFLIFDKVNNEYAGSTRFMNINWKDKVLEIGSTWIGKEFQGTGLNTQMKHLMLDYAFETLNFEKVEFRIDERNIRSRKAVEKLGCKLEGILRKNVFLKDGFKRNTCCYGLLKEEWQIQ
ncbi:MAG: GNAT family N-acetyltransferase [Flavobacteriales bacterium]|nr:GNAT family N-acetyltransferase [Flavobacteriia bacterium]NCP06728.1 GNAT family N-acetyltransferase [Flavobacteriales bacterium]PIV93731.1 MAG: N-acetyltransferase [Flavobacteriaceae bacterium CG17_big_fil_post_rev_8_21_14_2_50_33_15]PIY09759.1 MAG: N-acetyltransferase [Flavobacteriaceae bacterium CG_4_10_14_3_um_filter_33_47]PJB17437.1 MAG: N-acetyltransferase [Flavobacteriaceae bacterium CG_4_9_14_3_um_filter_33_16]